MKQKIHPGRRKLLVVATAGTVAVAAGAMGVAATYARGLSNYKTIIRTTWRNGDIVDGSWITKQRELVRYATLAANSHNTQPWRFRILDRSVMVLPDIRRRLPAVDPDNHHLFASLGCAVQNMVEAAPSLGLRAVPTYDVAAQGIRVDLESAPHARTGLFNAVPHRQSTRTVYDGRPVPPEHLTLLQAAGSGPAVRMLLFTEQRDREKILSYLIAGNDAQMRDMAFVKELKSWIRFSYQEALSTRDGLFAKSSGSPVLPSFVGPSMFRFAFTRESENKKYVSHLRSSAGVVVFVSQNNSAVGWTEAGRCCQRFALQATALKIRHAFINQPVEVPAVRGQFATYLGISGQRPNLVMRFGYGAELPKSLRRPVEQVIFTS